MNHSKGKRKGAEDVLLREREEMKTRQNSRMKPSHKTLRSSTSGRAAQDLPRFTYPFHSTGPPACSACLGPERSCTASHMRTEKASRHTHSLNKTPCMYANLSPTFPNPILPLRTYRRASSPTRPPRPSCPSTAGPPPWRAGATAAARSRRSQNGRSSHSWCRRRRRR